MQPRAILSLFALIGICDAAAIPESQTEELSDPNFTENVVKSDLPSAYSALPSAPCPLYNSRMLGLLKFFCPPPFGSSSVRIDDRIIADQEAVELANALIAYDQKLTTASSSIRVNEIIVSAIKLRSIIPEYVINFDSISESKSDRSNGKRAFEIPTASQLLINSINYVLEPLIDYWPKYEAALEEVVDFDFNGEISIDQLASEKDAETSEKTAESFEILSKIQQILQLKSPIPSETFSTTLLNRVNYSLSRMSGYSRLMQKYQIKAQSGPQYKKIEAVKKWIGWHYYLNEHLQKVVNILQESQ